MINLESTQIASAGWWLRSCFSSLSCNYHLLSVCSMYTCFKGQRLRLRLYYRIWSSPFLALSFLEICPLLSGSPSCPGSFVWFVWSDRWWTFYQNLSPALPVLQQLWSSSGQSHNKQVTHSMLLSCFNFWFPQNGAAFAQSSEFQANFLLYFPQGL